MNQFTSKAISSVIVGTFLPLSWQLNVLLEHPLALSKYLPITRSKSKLRTACATENALPYITLNTEKLLQTLERVDTPPPTLAREKQEKRTGKGAICQQSGRLLPGQKED